MSSLTPEESPIPESVKWEDIPEWERPLVDPERAEDEGYTCNCICQPKMGWKGKAPVAVDGDNWPLDFAANTLGVSEKDLRDLVRILGLEPAGTMRMASYRRSGRNPRAYNASKLVKIYSAIQELARQLDQT